MNTYKRIKQNRIKNIDSSDKIFDEIISSGQRSINKEEEEEDIENVVDNIQTELSQSTDANERLKPNHSIDNEEHDSQNTTKKRRSRKNTDFIDDLNKRRAHLSKRRKSIERNIKETSLKTDASFLFCCLSKNGVLDVCGTGNFELKNTFSVNEINKLISTNSSKISFGEVILKSLLPALSEQERGLVIDYMEKHSTEPKDDTNVRVWLRRFKRSKSNATELKPKRVYKTKKRISVEKKDEIEVPLITPIKIKEEEREEEDEIYKPNTEEFDSEWDSSNNNSDCDGSQDV